MPNVTVETIRDERKLADLVPEWRALEIAAGNTLPFRTAAWTIAWWKHLRQTRSALADELSLRAFRSGGRLVGVAPMMITARPGKGPIRVRCLQFLGTDPNVTEIRGPLFLPELGDACFLALADDVAERSTDWDWMVWSGVPAGAPSAARLESDGAAWTKRIPSYVLPLTGDWSSFKSALPRNVKESLRKCYNSLKRDNLPFELRVVRERGEMRAAADELFRLHAARAAQEDTIRHADVFEDRNVREFIVDVCERLADQGAARIFQLVIAGSVVATRVGFALNDTLYLYYSGFDPAYGKYSVMTTTVAEAIQYAFAEGFRFVNLSTGNDVSKTRWNPEERVHLEGEQIARGVRARMAHGAFHFALETLRSPRFAPYAQRLSLRRRG